MNNKLSEYRREIASLKKKLEFCEHILDNVPAYFYINEAGKTGNEYVMKNIYFNKAALDALCYTREEIDQLQGEFFKQILHKEDFDMTEKSIDFLCIDENHGRTFGGPYRFKPKNGEYIWGIGFCKALKPANGNPLWSFINCVVPLTEEMKADVQISQLLKENRRLVNKINLSKISKAELKVLKLITEGLPVKLIASKLNLSESTVMSHKKNMLKKLSLHNSASLVNFAHENGLN